MENTKIKLFEDNQVRTLWDAEKEEWYFSVVDVVGILTESKDPKQYLKKMRSRDEQLNLNWGTICTPVRMKSIDGKNREIQAATAEGIFRLIQSIPSPEVQYGVSVMSQVVKLLGKLELSEQIEVMAKLAFMIQKKSETFSDIFCILPL